MAKFSIDVRFKGGLSPSQQSVFQNAANRWAQIITSDIPSIRVRGEVLQALTIDASGADIDRGGDAKGNILGQATATDFLPNGLPIKGFMRFDSFDLGRMEDDGSLTSVILHEMGHVLGIGTIWDRKGVLAAVNSENPRFIGKKAGAEWAKLSKLPADQLPVENEGEPGTRLAHWRETVFGNELMTGFISGTTQPLSRMTIASLADLGYKVSFAKADPYKIPSHLEVRAMGIGAAPLRMRRCTMCNRPWKKIKPTVWSEDALV